MSRDLHYIADRYVTVKDDTAEFGEVPFYERKGLESLPTECLMCIEAENGMYSKYAHPKAHTEAHLEAGTKAQELAKKYPQEYLDYYTFYYGKEYKRIYSSLYEKYRDEYYSILLERPYEFGEICQHHSESISYHYELK